MRASVIERGPVLHVQKIKGIGGAERHLLDLLPGLRRRGVDARIVVLEAPGARQFVEEMVDRGVPVRSIGIRGPADPLAIADLAHIFGATRPALVHTHLIHADLHGGLAGAVRRVPTVASVHSVQRFYARRPYRTAARAAFARARRVIAISGHVRDYVTALGIVDPSKVRVVPYGVDAVGPADADLRATARDRFGVPQDAFVVAMTSRLIPGKGHDHAIDAVRRLGRRVPQVRLLIAGDGPLRPDLERAAEGSADVLFTGFLADVGDVLAAADALVFPTDPSLGEGFGLAALEALARGVPVVATDVASLPEVVGDAGILVPPADPTAIERALERLASDAALRARLAEAGPERARNHFSLSTMLDRTLEVYREAIGT